MEILHLTLKKKWFDMILSGEKKEEYREFKPFWITRFVEVNYPEETKGENKNVPHDIAFDVGNGHDPVDTIKSYYSKIKRFDVIHFYNGGSAWDKYRNFTIECKGVRVGKCIPEWSDNAKGNHFVIELGSILETRNIK